MVDLRAEMMLVLEQVGLEVILGHHEVAQGQGEIGIVFGDLIEAADNVQKYKYVCKMVAHLNGKTCTFMPKPLHVIMEMVCMFTNQFGKMVKIYSIKRVNMEIFLKWLDIM